LSGLAVRPLLLLVESGTEVEGIIYDEHREFSESGFGQT
jgi:hypothetical protein